MVAAVALGGGASVPKPVLWGQELKGPQKEGGQQMAAPVWSLKSK